MRLLNSKSISGKLTRLNLIVSGTALLLAYFAFLAYDLFTLRQDLVRSLSTEAAIVGANTVTALLFDDQEAAVNTLSALAGSPQIRWAVVLRPDRARFAQYTRDGADAPDLRHSLAPGEISRSWTTAGSILLGRRIVFEGQRVGEVYLLAETTSLKRSASQFGILSALILLLCFGIALEVTSTTRHLVTAPLIGLAETAQIVTREKDYSVRAAMPATSDDLAFLVQSFNEMLEQIQLRDRALEESRGILEQRVQERTAELTAANKEMEAFSYTVAHDLRGALQHISNVVFLLQSMLDAEARPELREFVLKLDESTQRMSGLIEDLLNLSRATSTPLHRTAVDLGAVAESIFAALKADQPDRQVKCTVSNCPRAIADEGLIRVVLQNLLGNAWKYTAKVKDAEIEFGCTEESGRTVYFVRDNGAGFDPRYSDRLFLPFQRLHSQSEFPGTGIGLTTTYRIVERHGGQIWAKSEVGKGAAFYFTLPDEEEL